MFKALIQKIVVAVGKVEWKATNTLTEDEKAKIKQYLGPNYYIICARRKNHLSTYFIGLGDLIFRGKFGHYSHVLMNVEADNPSDDDFKLIEALGSGVQYSPFEKVFNCHSVALLKPRCMSAEKWTAVLERAQKEEGVPYDTLFDLSDSSAMSCVESVRTALMAEPNYAVDFARFEKMVASSYKLTPQMFYDCPDFEVVYEVRH